MRVFVAVTPPEEAIRHLAARWEVARAERSMPVEGWHVTLEFLGDLDEDQLVGVRAGLAAIAADCRASRIRLAGAGAFGACGRKIVWAGLSGQVDRLAELASVVRAVTADALGVEPASTPFHGHLTLARDVADAGRSLGFLRSYRGPSWTVAELELMSSELVPAAAVPRVIRLSRLGRWQIGRR